MALRQHSLQGGYRTRHRILQRENSGATIELNKQLQLTNREPRPRGSRDKQRVLDAFESLLEIEGH
eukprot:9272389-Pyramimonas_sp.AAC.1